MEERRKRKGRVTMNKRPILAAALAAAALCAPAGALAAETAPQVPHTVTAEATQERIAAFSGERGYRGVAVSDAWLRQARLDGSLLNMRLYTAMGETVPFREKLTRAPSDADTMCLYMQARSQDEAVTMQLDQPAIDALRRLGISELVITDYDRYVRARYSVDELEAVREALGLGAAEQLCVSGEDAPVTVVSEDGVRRLVNHP